MIAPFVVLGGPMVRTAAGTRVALIAATVLALVAPLVPQAAHASESNAAVSTASWTSTCTPPKAQPMAGPYPRLYRPWTVYGDRDASVHSIKHVREAEYRLRWAGLYKGRITGYFGYELREAVKSFQRKNCMKTTGKLDPATWAHLITKSTRAMSKVPSVCKGRGWHSCYDRASHQDFLFHDGQLINVWLVRGGSKAEQTRTGTYKVYARYSYKISTLFDVPMWYFQKHSGGQGQHGSGFMLDPFVGHSHGCINMYIPDAKVLWAHTRSKPLTVTVYGAWS
jgi:hypothetical protein